MEHNMRRNDLYQIALIFLGIVATIFFGMFFLRELFPEYKIYQDDFVALEKFRSTYTGEQSTPFKKEVKQIVLEREDKGPAVIDRCISCHVALEISDYSPTKIKYDINGNIVYDQNGLPQKISNENYIWKRIDDKISELKDSNVNEHLQSQGDSKQVKARLKEAEDLSSFKTAHVDEYVYDVEKVLQMHPLIGKEIRPFEFHPIEEYGCTSCHNGNGRGLTTDKAHGPVFDGQYDTHYQGPRPIFTESDPENDPRFSKEFNFPPGEKLIFQTNPIFVGPLIQAKCLQCHQANETSLKNAVFSANAVTNRRAEKSKAINTGLQNEKDSLKSLLILRSEILKNGYRKTLARLKLASKDFSLPTDVLKHYEAQIKFLSVVPQGTMDTVANGKIVEGIDNEINSILGSKKLTLELEYQFNDSNADFEQILNTFIKSNLKNPDAKGTLFEKIHAVEQDKKTMSQVEITKSYFAKSTSDENFLSALASDMDVLTSNYHRGQELYISQACYACHRIAGMARGGVGPELTREGLVAYPWYIKQKLVWPQGDLKTSTMPNYRLDHHELEDLMTFLLGQRGENSSLTPTVNKLSLQEWEAGKKLPWEEPIKPSKIHDLRNSMTVFATQGCAACHRLKGYESNVGLSSEKLDTQNFEKLYQEKQWFEKLFPENIIGSEIVSVLSKHAEEIDAHIIDNVRKDSIIEEILQKDPDAIISFYTPFRFASRAKNFELNQSAEAEKDPLKREAILEELQQWKKRVTRVLMIYVQEYGLGRQVGPRPNWSGVYRSDEWLMEHFHNPTAHIAHSIMPVFPFDDSKFYALTYMLDALGIRNTKAVKTIWENRGFNSEAAYHIFCAQCHGDFLQGNGPVAAWIYPIPKNLRNGEFLRNLTKERAIQSITHGVSGTPMAPWGELAKNKSIGDGMPVLSTDEINQLVNWLFSNLPGGMVIKSSQDVPKWQYTPQDVLKELKDEGNKKHFEKTPKNSESNSTKQSPLSSLPRGENYYASLQPIVVKSEQKDDITDIFDVKAAPVPGPEKNGFYINKEFYTPNNLAAGKHFFEINCAACHGKEADGSGLRAEAMVEAKPRMLINLDWLQSKDDLRLLRSIKYGVAGTAMTPWGDFTSSMQRLQLVMYIRSLSQEREQRDLLSKALYTAFENTKMNIDETRGNEFQALDRLQNDLKDAQSKQDILYNNFQKGRNSSEEALKNYQNQLKLVKGVESKKEVDQTLLELKKLIDQEEKLYQTLGLMMLGTLMENDPLLSKYYDLIKMNGNLFILKEGALANNVNSEKMDLLKSKQTEIIQLLNKKVSALESNQLVLQGKMPSVENREAMTDTKARISALTKLINTFIASTEEAQRTNKKQVKIFDAYQTMHNSDNQSTKIKEINND